jgi:hypothetical protein
MKRFVLVLSLCLLSLGSAFAMGFFVTPSLSLDLGSQNYVRGGCAGGQALFDIGGLAIGVEVKADYDAWFNVFNVPCMALVGFGRDFWIGVGQTLAVGAPNVGGAAWRFGAFPNTYALGVNVLRLPLPFAELLVQSEISYTLNGAVDSASMGGIDMIVAILTGLKATAGVGLELKL